MAGLHEVPMFVLESRVSTPHLTGRWTPMLSAGLLSLDEVECMKIDLSECSGSLLQYRARQLPEFGEEVIEFEVACCCA